MDLKCGICGDKSVYKVWGIGNGIFACRDCYKSNKSGDTAITDTNKIAAFHQTISVETGHGKMIIPKIEYDEIDDAFSL